MYGKHFEIITSKTDIQNGNDLCVIEQVTQSKI